MNTAALTPSQLQGELPSRKPGQALAESPTGQALRPVVSVVATLAEGRQVEKAGVFRLVVQVGHRQHHDGAGNGVGLMIRRPAPLAPIPGPVEPDEPASQVPILRVTAFHFGTDGHGGIIPLEGTPAQAAGRNRPFWKAILELKVTNPCNL